MARWLGYTREAEGDAVEAGRLFAESLALNRRTGEARGVAACLVACAGLAGRRGHHEPAARLLGATAVLLDATGASALLQSDRPHHERVLAATRTALGEEALAHAWSDGRAITLDAAVALALAQATPDATFA